jgi:hypothetical protein
VVLPTQLPDGLLEVQRAGQQGKELFVVEMATYPDGRVADQLTRDAMLFYLDRQVWPGALATLSNPSQPSLSLHSPSRSPVPATGRVKVIDMASGDFTLDE